MINIIPKTEQLTEGELLRIDKENRNYIYAMCRNCNFYDNRCTKGRIARKCAKEGLKNKE